MVKRLLVKLLRQHEGELRIVRQKELLDGCLDIAHAQVNGGSEERLSLLELCLSLLIGKVRENLVSRTEFVQAFYSGSDPNVAKFVDRFVPPYH